MGDLSLKQYAEVFSELIPEIEGGLVLRSYERHAIYKAYDALREKAESSEQHTDLSAEVAHATERQVSGLMEE